MSRPKAKTRERGYTLIEAKLLLRATFGTWSGKISLERKASQRWVQWLSCYTGSRVNEITQMAAGDIYQEPLPDGTAVWVMRITPDAGSDKGHTARIVPLHPYLIKQGFLEYVASMDGKLLFYGSAPRCDRRPECAGRPCSGERGRHLRRFLAAGALRRHRVAAKSPTCGALSDGRVQVRDRVNLV